MNNDILRGIFSLEYIKSLQPSQLSGVAQTLRKDMIEIIEKQGGHLSSNLGAIELTIALHYVFDSPNDKLIFDVGHQAYTHKILTNRGKIFDQIRQLGGLSGFTRREESAHDIVSTGHASVSLSVAAGLVAANVLSAKALASRVVAVIGDAGLSGGVSFEALNHIGEQQLPVIIVLNDNQMSIGNGCGALHGHLEQITDKENNYFTHLGFTYWGLHDGHNIEELVELFKWAREFDKPLVIHVRTIKGKGHELAEQNPIGYHGITVERMCHPEQMRPTYTQIFAKKILELAKNNHKIIAISPAMIQGSGLYHLAEELPNQCIDVGIAEQHAVALASGLALGGYRPVVALYSTFLQRAVDQVIHDVAMQKIPMVITLDRAGVVAGDGESHQGVYDIALLQSLANLVFLAPASANELEQMLAWAFEQRELVVIRYPKDMVPALEYSVQPHQLNNREGSYWRYHQQVKVLVVALGATCAIAHEVLKQLAEVGVEINLYNPRFVAPLRESVWQMVLKPYDLVITVEEGVLRGGWGASLSLLAQSFYPQLNVVNIGITNPLLPQGLRDELLTLSGLDAVSMKAAIVEAYDKFIGLPTLNYQEQVSDDV